MDRGSKCLVIPGAYSNLGEKIPMVLTGHVKTKIDQKILIPKQIMFNSFFRDPLITQILCDSNMVFKCFLCIRLKLLVQNLDVLDPRSINTELRSMSVKK